MARKGVQAGGGSLAEKDWADMKVGVLGTQN